MVQRGKPKDVDNYIFISSDEKIYELQLKGICQSYLDFDGAYFDKNKVKVVAMDEIG